MHDSKPDYDIKRLDHLGIVAGVIKDLKIVEMIDERLGTYEDETLSAGETVAGMIINGLGFSNKPLSLMPLFFENCPLEQLFREGVKAEDFNRFKLGRVLDRCHSYGTELLFSEISLKVCQQEQVDTCFNSKDTTSFTLSGDYLGKTNDDTVQVTLGHSKDHRPDLKQVMLEMMVTQDGGIPLIGKALSGNASDNTVFKERSEKLVEQFKAAEIPRYLIADSKLYTEANAANLKELAFITRIPNTIKQVGETIDKALATPDTWQTLDDGRFMQTFNINHYGMQQRWHVISSDTSRQRATKQVNQRVLKEADSIKKQLFHLQAKRFRHSDDARQHAETLAKKWKLHRLTDTQIIEHQKYEGRGRPKEGQQPTVTTYQIQVNYGIDEETIAQLKASAGHYIIGGNAEALSDQEVATAYQKQHHVERGFRFLKDPLFFASSLFVKTPQRIMGLLMVMLLSLLVYGIAERRLRTALKELKETLPNQIGKEINNPTLRWVFQLLHGIHCLKISRDKSVNYVIKGLTTLRKKILWLFGESVANIYQISSG